MDSFNSQKAVVGFTRLLSTSSRPARLPSEGLLKSGPNVSSMSETHKDTRRTQVFPPHNSQPDEFVHVGNSMRSRTPLPIHRVDPNINVIITKEATAAISGTESRPMFDLHHNNTMSNTSQIGPHLSESRLEHTTATRTNPALWTHTPNEPAQTTPLESSFHRSDSVIPPAAEFLPPTQTDQNNSHDDGFAIPWGTMLFTKRAAIANLATLGRTTKRAIKCSAGKSSIANITRALAYADCTSVDVKQYMLLSPGDAAAIRRIWPELVIFNATGSISYEIIRQSLIEWGPTGINGLEEFELIVIGWMRLVETQQLSRLDPLVKYRNFDPAHLSPFLQVRGIRLNARFWTPKGLKKLREDIWEVIDGGEEFRRKPMPVPDTKGQNFIPQAQTSHLSLLSDGLGIYAFRIQLHNMSTAIYEHNESVSDASNVARPYSQKQLAVR
ncbi:hypothetical protein BKA64DRAFT_640231 [Cadophora sp. MPI-SDFR-AT-0126]|nr:hypothetical protein BKA64DRAFT_640231 [Leotiomycetes sp. MPI-SDFR-AT-0126]